MKHKSVRIAVVFLALIAILLIAVQIGKAEAPTGRIIVCHLPPPGPFWLEVDQSALPGHLQHGDYQGFPGLECGGVPYCEFFGNCPTPSPSPEPSPTATLSPSPTVTPTLTATVTPTISPTSTPIPPTSTPTNTPGICWPTPIGFPTPAPGGPTPTPCVPPLNLWAPIVPFHYTIPECNVPGCVPYLLND